MFLEACERIAKGRGITREQYFKQNPRDYEKYLQLGRDY